MAIGVSNIGCSSTAAGYMAYNLWGGYLSSIMIGGFSYNDLFATRNVTSGARDASTMKLLAATASQTEFSYVWTTPGTHVFTVNANCAWRVSLDQATIFTISSTTGYVLSGSNTTSLTAIIGGNGTVTINRNTTSNPGYSTTMRLARSNGAGGIQASALTWGLATSY